MAIQILSDLHLEAPKAYDIFAIVPKAPYLALLGDIGTIVSHKNEYLAFLTTRLKQFRAVLFVPGNHEAYHSNWPDTLDALRTFERDVRKDETLGEFVLLDRASFRIPDTNGVILGCSLFSQKTKWQSALGSMTSTRTGDWDVGTHNEAHRRDLAWLNAQVAEYENSEEDVKIMIFSHWSPSLDERAIEPRHAGSKVSSAFSTDFAGEVCFRSDKVKVWAFGHTHYNCDFVVEREEGAGGLRLLTHQRGYYFAQADGFDGEKVVQV